MATKLEQVLNLEIIKILKIIVKFIKIILLKEIKGTINL